MSFAIAFLAIIIPVFIKLIETNQQLKIKKLEILLLKKLDVFEKLLKDSSIFVYSSSRDGMEYQNFLVSYQNARMISTNNTRKALDELSLAANKLRATPNPLDKGFVQSKEYYDAMEKVVKEMNNDISNLTAGIIK